MTGYSLLVALSSCSSCRAVDDTIRSASLSVRVRDRSCKIQPKATPFRPESIPLPRWMSNSLTLQVQARSGAAAAQPRRRRRRASGRQAVEWRSDEAMRSGTSSASHRRGERTEPGAGHLNSMDVNPDVPGPRHGFATGRRRAPSGQEVRMVWRIKEALPRAHVCRRRSRCPYASARCAT